jgi:hypothetical protein
VLQPTAATTAAATSSSSSSTKHNSCLIQHISQGQPLPKWPEPRHASSTGSAQRCLMLGAVTSSQPNNCYAMAASAAVAARSVMFT